jgi:hypothetical protein
MYLHGYNFSYCLPAIWSLNQLNCCRKKHADFNYSCVKTLVENCWGEDHATECTNAFSHVIKETEEPVIEQEISLLMDEQKIQ